MLGEILGGAAGLLGIGQSGVNLASSINSFGLDKKYYKLQKEAFDFNRDLAKDQWYTNKYINQLNANMALQDFYSGHQIEMNDLKAAGINPMLAVGGMSGNVQMPGNVSAEQVSAPSGSGSSSPAGMSGLSDVMDALNALDPDRKKSEQLDLMGKDADLNIKHQQAELIKAQKDAILRNTPGVQIQETKRYHDAQIRAQEARNEILKESNYWSQIKGVINDVRTMMNQ